MRGTKNSFPLLLVGFLLNGSVPFSIFLVAGITYAVGATHQILVLFISVALGGFAFSAAGLSLSKHGGTVGYSLLLLSFAAFLIVFIMLMESMVTSLWELGAYAFLSMSSNSLISYSISRVANTLRNRPLSPLHFISIGSGAPVLFLSLFFVYAYLGYSNLPLIALVSQLAVFIFSTICIMHFSGSLGSKTSRGAA